MFFIRPRPLDIPLLRLGRLQLGLSLVYVNGCNQAVFQLYIDDANLLGIGRHGLAEDRALCVEGTKGEVVLSDIRLDRQSHDGRVDLAGARLGAGGFHVSANTAEDIDLVGQIHRDQQILVVDRGRRAAGQRTHPAAGFLCTGVGRIERYRGQQVTGSDSRQRPSFFGARKGLADLLIGTVGRSLQVTKHRIIIKKPPLCADLRRRLRRRKFPVSRRLFDGRALVIWPDLAARRPEQQKRDDNSPPARRAGGQRMPIGRGITAAVWHWPRQA